MIYDLMIVGNDWKDQLLAHIWRPNNYVLSEYERSFKYADKIEFDSIEEQMQKEYKNADKNTYSTFEEYMKENYNYDERHPQHKQYGVYRAGLGSAQPKYIGHGGFLLSLKEEANGNIVYVDKKKKKVLLEHLEVRPATAKTRKVTQAFKKDIDIKKTLRRCPGLIINKGDFYSASMLMSLFDDNGEIPGGNFEKRLIEQGEKWYAFYQEMLIRCGEEDMISIFNAHC